MKNEPLVPRGLVMVPGSGNGVTEGWSKLPVHSFLLSEMSLQLITAVPKCNDIPHFFRGVENVVQISTQLSPTASHCSQSLCETTTMGNRRISADIKECALRLWDVGWELEDICWALMVSHRSIYRWQAIFIEHGSVNRLPSPMIGPTRILTRALLTACQTLYQSDSDLYLDEIVTWLALTHDIVISTSTLSRNLIEAGLTRKILHKIAAECDGLLRQEWKDSICTNF
jgi:transposase